MLHMMIDFETLATTPDAAIASLGYTVFDHSGIIESGGWVVNLTSTIMLGGVVDPETVKWWQKQDEQAQENITNGGVPIGQVMSDLQIKWDERGCDFIWSHGAIFDIVIAEHYFRKTDVSIPWKYSAARDTRTLFDIATTVGWEKPVRETAHVAEQDAIDQTEDLLAAFKHLDFLAEQSFDL